MNWFPCPAICRWRKCAPFAVAPNHASLSPTPCERYAVSPTGNIRDIPFVVLVGGSSLDFEIPSWSPTRWHTTGWLPGAATSAAVKAHAMRSPADYSFHGKRRHTWRVA
nr:Diol dehydratase-reactivating factor large subunit [Klebsiella pneumoniae]